MSKATATLEYDFSQPSDFKWVAIATWNTDLSGHGETPEEAIKSLEIECYKHSLFPEESGLNYECSRSV